MAGTYCSELIKTPRNFGNQSLPAQGMLLSPINDTDAMYAAPDSPRQIRTDPALRNARVTPP